jgi:hypothetical protein
MFRKIKAAVFITLSLATVQSAFADFNVGDAVMYGHGQFQITNINSENGTADISLFRPSKSVTVPRSKSHINGDSD